MFDMCYWVSVAILIFETFLDKTCEHSLSTLAVIHNAYYGGYGHFSLLVS